MRTALATLFVALAVRLYPKAAMFPVDEDLDRLTPEKWAALLILHAEAVHGCEHTDQARRELGLVGPAGQMAVDQEGASS